jgi:hypothetical protein
VERNQKGKQQMTSTNDENLQIQTAVYNDTVSRLRQTQPELSDAQMHERGLAAVESSVWGHGAKKDRKGNFIQQGIGSPGHETANHFQAILRYSGRQEWEKAVAEIWKRDPARAAALNLPTAT